MAEIKKDIGKNILNADLKPSYTVHKQKSSQSCRKTQEGLNLVALNIAYYPADILL